MESKDLRTEILPGSADSAKILRLASSLRMTNWGDISPILNYYFLQVRRRGRNISPTKSDWKQPDKMELAVLNQ